MAPRLVERPEVEFGDPPIAKPFRGPRWTIGRIATDLAIVAFAVPFALHTLAPPRRSECGTTLDNLAMMTGFWFLVARFLWIEANRNRLIEWQRSPPSTHSRKRLTP